MFWANEKKHLLELRLKKASKVKVKEKEDDSLI